MSTTTEQPDVSIVIVNWNAQDYLRDCLRSIAEQTRACTYEAIVVDNASRDGSQEMLRSEFPDVTAILNEANAGFAAANNQGIAVSRGRYVLLLNPDTLILDGAIDTCVAYADELRDARVAVLGCQVWEDADAIQKTCFRFPSPLNTLLNMLGLTQRYPRSRFFGRAEMGRWDRRDERDVDVVSGMFMLVRREALDEVGPMDPDYFIYAEEADWCYRFRQHGWRCVFTPRARIMHLEGGGQSTKLVSARMYVQLQKSLLQFHRKNRGPVSWALAQAVYAVVMPLRSAALAGPALLGRSARGRGKFRQALAATRYHLFRIEPQA
jgi:GT2 family glycosyltransferase